MNPFTDALDVARGRPGTRQMPRIQVQIPGNTIINLGQMTMRTPTDASDTAIYASRVQARVCALRAGARLKNGVRDVRRIYKHHTGGQVGSL
jgi:hypothetical protein